MAAGAFNPSIGREIPESPAANLPGLYNKVPVQRKTCTQAGKSGNESKTSKFLLGPPDAHTNTTYPHSHMYATHTHTQLIQNLEVTVICYFFYSRDRGSF